MIKIIDNIEEKKVSVTYDIYIPIDIKFGDGNNVLKNIVYWRTGDLIKSLIEIGIDKYTKEVRSITLVICDKVYKNKKIYTQYHSTAMGCPIVEECDFKEKAYIDEYGLLEICFEGNSVYILFSETKVTRCIKNKNVEFLLDNKNNWLGICIKDIDEEDVAVLRAHYNTSLC